MLQLVIESAPFSVVDETLGQSVNISWNMFDPPIAAKAWRRWTQSDFANVNLNAIEHPESLLNGIVTHILKQALLERLPRSTGWQIDAALSTQIKTALKTTAGIYKRGVAVREGTVSTTPKTLIGSYLVQIADADIQILNAINSDNFLVVDQNVFQHHKQLFSKRPDAFVIQLDEHSKRLSSVRKIIGGWKASKQSKQSEPWCLIGGGILTDTAAFAASLCHCESEFLPTTLLAMADACVGGKTGVNAEGFGKNLIGKFYFPRKVLAWPGWLHSLDQRQLNAGAFECLKHYIINNDLPAAIAFAQLIVKKELTAIAAVLPTIIKVKADVVEQDPAETGKRAILNLGHTLGHAIEGLSQKLTTGSATILHGEAVGVGMMFALYLSTKLSGLPNEEADKRVNILKLVSEVNSRTSLQIFFAGKDPASTDVIVELQSFINQDKKATSSGRDESQWILLGSSGEVKGPSQTTWTYALDMSQFPTMWTEFLKNYC